MDVALEISHPGRCVQWKRDACRTIIELLIPGYPTETLYNGDGQTTNMWRDRLASLRDLAGFRINPLALVSIEGIVVYYLNVYTTEKSMTTHSHAVGAFTHLLSTSLSPQHIKSTLLQLEKQSAILRECLDLGHVGAARLEARVALADAPRVLVTVPTRLTQECVAIVLPETLWYVTFLCVSFYFD